MNKVTLHCTEGTSNKVYVIWMEPKGNGFEVLAQWGRVGNALQSGSKSNGPVPEDKAKAMLDKVVKEKKAKGYVVEGNASVPEQTVVEEPKDTGIRMMLLTAGTEDDLEWLLKDDNWAAQQKMNGKRIGLIASDGGVLGINRRGLACSISKHVVDAFKETAVSLDGELIGDVYYAFDMLGDTKNILLKRQANLEQTVKDLDSKYVKAVPLALGEEDKRKLLAWLRKERKEGIVFKKVDGLYHPGRATDIKKAENIKVKFYAEGSFIVEKWNEKNSIAIQAYDGKKKVHVGNVTVPEKYKDQITVGGIVNVRYLYATEGSILYQPNLDPDDTGNVMRTDLEEKDCSISQLKFEGKEE